MSGLRRELVFLILQYLEHEKLNETARKLEQESGFYFNMRYFEDQVLAGEWNEVEKYLHGFTRLEDNRYSIKIFFEIRKQKYLEALDRHDGAKALEILMKDLKVFASFSEQVFKDITELLTLDDFRQKEVFSKYGDTKSARNKLLSKLKPLIKENPLVSGKLHFPVFEPSRLKTLINQSLNWQHQQCKNSRLDADIKTLFTDHKCALTDGDHVLDTTKNPPIEHVSKAERFPAVGAHGPFQPVVSLSPKTIARQKRGFSPIRHAVAAASSPGLVRPPKSAAFLKHPTEPTATLRLESQPVNSEQLMKRMRTGKSDEVAGLDTAAHPPKIYLQQDLPKVVVRNLNQGANVTSLDFHPQQQTILLVGTNVGDISVWEVGSQERLTHKTFEVWNILACTLPLQMALMKDAKISVNRCVWSPDGLMLGVAFSKHIVQMYTYSKGQLRQHLEIDAHVGGVNDIAFSHPNKQLSIVTCGDDKTIKVWDVVFGRQQYIFEGHDAPVYSICPHQKFSVQYIFSTATDGKIKGWLYDGTGPRIDHDAPGLRCTTMAYSADGSRLFSCGTSEEGDSHLVEWNEIKGAVKRTYTGFTKRSLGVVQFDTSRNCFLAAGDDFQIKFWNMDSSNILATIDADGGLPASPRLRFNRGGSLLAVSTRNNGIKILANTDGLELIRILKCHTVEGTKGPAEPINTKLTSLASTIDRSDKITPAVSIAGLGPTESGRTLDVEPVVGEDIDKAELEKLSDAVQLTSLAATIERSNKITPAVSIAGPVPNEGGRKLDVEPVVGEDVDKAELGKLSDAMHFSLAATIERFNTITPAVSIAGLGPSENGRTLEVGEDVDKAEIEKSDIADLSELKALRLPDPLAAGKVEGLLYIDFGYSVLALLSTATHKLWKWPRNKQNPSEKSTTFVAPRLWKPISGTPMTNDTNKPNQVKEPAACIALSKNDSYVVSASGGKISIFNRLTFEVIATFMPPPPAATYLAFYPQDNNIIAVGMEDSTIQIYNAQRREIKIKLRGHQDRITGLAFSQSLNVLVSSGADAQLCVWSIEGWKKTKSRFIEVLPGGSGPLVGETKVQFHKDQNHVLVVHKSQIAVYDTNLRCLHSWSPREVLPAPISSAIYSTDGLLIYAGFCDGAIGVFDSDSLKLRCRVASTSYLPTSVSGNSTVYPSVIAAHPTEPNQIALGMSDGTVYVLEPSEAQGKWGS